MTAETQRRKHLDRRHKRTDDSKDTPLETTPELCSTTGMMASFHLYRLPCILSQAHWYPSTYHLPFLSCTYSLNLRSRPTTQTATLALSSGVRMEALVGWSGEERGALQSGRAGIAERRHSRQSLM